MCWILIKFADEIGFLFKLQKWSSTIILSVGIFCVSYVLTSVTMPDLQSSDRYASHIVSDVVEKNIDSSSKWNPLRRRGKNYDASKWRHRRRRRKKEESRRTFNKNSRDLLTAITHTEILRALHKTNKQFNKKTKLWKQNGRCLDDVTTYSLIVPI